MKRDIKYMKIKSLFESKFIKVFDLQYGEGRHYYNATRRDENDLVAANPQRSSRKCFRMR